jgi:uracil-DNA glycosylase family 4
MPDSIPVFSSLKLLNDYVCECRRCPRLVHFRQQVPEKAKFSGQRYWKRPVPGFGDPQAYLLILGLAPSAQGGNRTGRIFTGDESARFLFQGLYQQGFASQPTSESIDDGLKLFGCYITASVKCVPPDNRPTATEQNRCFPYLLNEMNLLKNLSAVLTLGGFAFNAFLHYVKSQGGPKTAHTFKHGEKYSIEGFPSVYACYHPSPQNTNTGRMNQKMLCTILQQIQQDYRATSSLGQ